MICGVRNASYRAKSVTTHTRTQQLLQMVHKYIRTRKEFGGSDLLLLMQVLVVWMFPARRSVVFFGYALLPFV